MDSLNWEWPVLMMTCHHLESPLKGFVQSKLAVLEILMGMMVLNWLYQTLISCAAFSKKMTIYWLPERNLTWGLEFQVGKIKS